MTSKRSETNRKENMACGARCEAGSVIVELALGLSTLVLLLVGVLELGRSFHTSITVAHAATAGVVYGTQSLEHSKNLTAIEQRARNDGKDLSGLTVTSQRVCRCQDGSTISCSATSCGSGDPPWIYVQVTSQKTFDTLFRYPGVPSPLQINHKTEMRVR